jgi:hypothetical protein
MGSNWLGLAWLCSNGERALGGTTLFSLGPTFFRNVHKVKKLLWNKWKFNFPKTFCSWNISYFNYCCWFPSMFPRQCCCGMWVQFFWGTSCNIYYFFILTYYCCWFLVPTSPLVTRWNWYFFKVPFQFLGNFSSWNIISWGTVPGSHANPASPCLVRALPTTRRGLSRTPATKTESSFVLLFFDFALSQASIFYFFIYFLVCCSDFFFSCCAAYCCHNLFFLIFFCGGKKCRWIEVEWRRVCEFRESWTRGLGTRLDVHAGGKWSKMGIWEAFLNWLRRYISLSFSRCLWILLLPWWWLW